MIPTNTRIFVCTVPQDMRRGFDGLALAARQLVGEDVRSGAMVCFVNKRRNRLKVIWWERNGYAVLYKRLHRAIFAPPTSSEGGASVRIDTTALARLIEGISRPENTRETGSK